MLRPFETGQIIQADKRDPFTQIRPGQSLGELQATNSTPFLGRPVLNQTSQLSTLQGLDLSSVINPIRPGMNTSGGGLTLAGMAQQPIQQPTQNPLGGGLSSLNQQPFSTSLQPQQFGMNQQPQQINGGIRSLLDSYIGNYINNYFKNALR